MRVLRVDENLEGMPRTVVTVGNFDGLHRGHATLVKELTHRARTIGAQSILLTFLPHTRQVLGGDVQLLTTLSEKAHLCEQLGVDTIAWLPFDENVAQLTPKQFVDTILVKRLNAVEWVMGENHSFGKDRKGHGNSLRSSGSINHINVFTVKLHTGKDSVISSTDIRRYVSDGKIDKAVETLGHPYLVEAQRVGGLKIGTELGFPTLNFRAPASPKVIPPAGVYAAELEVAGRTWTGALYYGNCPTFEKRDFHFEFHALETTGAFPEDNEQGNIWIHRFIRADQAFGTTEDLVKQIRLDIASVKQYFL